MIISTNSVIRVGGGSTPPETPTDALLFYSPNEIGLSKFDKTKSWERALYYSTDHTNWTEWDGATEIVSALSDGYHKIYLRGVGNTKITGSTSSNARFVVRGGMIKCVGNCNNLLDYTTEPTLGSSAFGYLFYKCSNVEFDVTLPATTLANNCYYYMFQECKSIRKATALPATTLKNYCYIGMYQDCISLTELPALPATTLANSCCYSMFQGCTSIKLSTEQTGDYQTEYRIPISGTGTDYSSAMNFMFASTGGTFVGTPTINTTYYTSNTVIPAT